MSASWVALETVTAATQGVATKSGIAAIWNVISQLRLSFTFGGGEYGDMLPNIVSVISGMISRAIRIF
jgi:hypothetical protein